MKRLADLTAEDLVANPVWRYEGGSGAEALVVPANRKSLSQMDDEIFLAATEFELFDSTRHFGFCFPADDSGIDYLQPVIVGPSRQVSFWFDGPVAPEVLASQWTALGKQSDDIFPVAFRCLVPVDGGTVSGRIAGVEVSQPLSSESPAVGVSIDPGPTEVRGATATSSQSADRILTARPVEARWRGIGTTDARTARRRKANGPSSSLRVPCTGPVSSETSPPEGCSCARRRFPAQDRW